MAQFQKLQSLSLLTSAALLISGCSPGYLMRAAYEEGKILVRRRPIERVLLDPTITEEERAKLELVLDVRSYAEKQLGLTIGRSFTKYTRIDTDVVSWVVVGSKKDSFTLRTWWFPIVGSVPYKGFFDREDADALAAELEREGLETWIRGAETFSTLGWFNDPILSSTLKQPASRIADTIIHESLHSTIWFPDQVVFNESLANFVGSQGAADYFAAKHAQCPATDSACLGVSDLLLTQTKLMQQRENEIAQALGGLTVELETLYNSAKSSDEKIQERETIFVRHLAPLHAAYPDLSVLQKINNAEIIQLRIYLTNLELFSHYFERCGRSWPTFLKQLRSIQERYLADRSLDPFALIREDIEKHPLP